MSTGGLVTLNWRDHAIGVLAPCRLCGRGALMRDAFGRPCHKVCAERLEPAVLASAARPQPLAPVVDLSTVAGRRRARAPCRARPAPAHHPTATAGLFEA